MKVSLASKFFAALLACSSTVGWAAPTTVTPGTYLFNFTYSISPPPNVYLSSVTLFYGASGIGAGDAGFWKLFDGLNGTGFSVDLTALGLGPSGTGGGLLTSGGGDTSALLTVTSGSFTVDPFVQLDYVADLGYVAPPSVTISGVLVEPSVVPEPATLALVGLGLIGASVARRKRTA